MSWHQVAVHMVVQEQEATLHKQITVFTSSPFKWVEDVVYNQINSHLDNTKCSIWVMSVESSRGSLSLATSNVPDKDDLEVFNTLFKSELK